MSRAILIRAGLLGATGVSLGAMGGHALKQRLQARDKMASWEIAVRYQTFSAAALLGLYAITLAGNGGRGMKKIRIAAELITVGSVMFSGSIYWLSLSEEGNKIRRVLGPMTPLGGLAMIAGWLALLF
ncbi:UPF0382 membrane protein [Zancudomyces culisetae]|uniref:UPF0382 membrane protein n=1 Tax=Zancudomyces culisetae TaxID=1213189 RepID=A0A1R1PK73_ZANCU|nr:UPF0382 membrane protein [Zancudomyces culisetae]|eukprot:OMH81368.1 UPF0382 membrane protein [Zancudomyces culisetae]